MDAMSGKPKINRQSIKFGGGMGLEGRIANNEKNKLASAVAEISREIKQAKAVITKTSDLSLQMEKTIEERMASILKLVRNG